MKKIFLLLLLSPIYIYAQNTHDTGRIYELVQQMPTFNGDVPTYVRSHFVYPPEDIAKKIEGTVVVTYTVEKDGRITGAYAIHSVEHSIDSSAIACISAMKWNPGKLNGVAVRVKGAIPITVTKPIIDSNSVNPRTPPPIR